MKNPALLVIGVRRRTGTHRLKSVLRFLCMHWLGSMMNTPHPADKITRPCRGHKQAGQRYKKPHTAQQGVETVLGRLCPTTTGRNGGSSGPGVDTVRAPLCVC
jgi:hypothetical protein